MVNDDDFLEGMDGGVPARKDAATSIDSSRSVSGFNLGLKWNVLELQPVRIKKQGCYNEEAGIDIPVFAHLRHSAQDKATPRRLCLVTREDCSWP